MKCTVTEIETARTAAQGSAKSPPSTFVTVWPREFVVMVLKAEFRMNEAQANAVMMTAHRKGVCVVAVFARDIAETKASRATDAGKAKGFPLQFTTEPEE